VKGNILDYDKLLKILKNVDIISHHAAQLKITESQVNPILDLKINVEGTLNIFKAAIKNEVLRVIFASSACVYGQPIFLPQTENHPTNPNWVYGVSKLACEKYATVFQQSNNLRITCLRYAIVFGPKEWFRRVLPIFIKNAVDNKPLIIFNKCNTFRDFIYVNDVVEFHNICISNDKTIGEIYNVGGGKHYFIKDLAQIVIKTTKSKSQIIYEKVTPGGHSSLITGKRRNINDLLGMYLDISKAKKLNWQPKYSLEFGIKETMNWYKNNRKRWETIL
jgi:UDP-glucose 4-epimerase